jgi:glycosyltransferase involved in cell wall biosynthesis/GR25 family glycosyltransferase involved in LPS biosynthesis
MLKWKLPDQTKQYIKTIAHKILPKEFNYSVYLSLYNDLKESGITTEEEAIEHYILFGKNEGRICFYEKLPEQILAKTNHSYYDKIYTKKPINNLFDQIYVISIKNQETDKYIYNYLSKFKIKYKKISAINGNTNKSILKYYKNYLTWADDHPNRHQLDNKKNRLILGPGAIGLVETYKKIYKDAIKNKYKTILVFEEDVLLDKNFNLHVNNFFSKSGIKDFDLLFLGASHHVWNDHKIIQIEDTDTKYYKAPQIIDGSFAIGYNCKILPDLLNNMKVINSPIDSGPIRSITKNDNSYVIYPNIAIADTTPKSSISGLSRNLRFHKTKMRWNVNNIDFTRATLKTSIIIANYNGEKTIGRCIRSALNQTYPNTEIIIVDDTSTDRSTKIIKKYCKQDKRVNLIESPKNIGAYECRNIGLEHSKGFFITLLDNDDIFLSKKIEIDLYNYINYHEYEIFFSNIYRSQNINLNKYLKDDTILTKINQERQPEIVCDEKKCIYGHNTSWNYKFRFGLPSLFVEKSFFDKYGIWNSEYRYGMDLELIQRYVAKKYNEYIDHKTLWPTIYNYQADKYGIFLSRTMNYVSFPMNTSNATNVCDTKKRDIIHQKCNENIQKLIKI